MHFIAIQIHNALKNIYGNTQQDGQSEKTTCEHWTFCHAPQVFGHLRKKKIIKPLEQEIVSYVRQKTTKRHNYDVNRKRGVTFTREYVYHVSAHGAHLTKPHIIL